MVEAEVQLSSEKLIYPQPLSLQVEQIDSRMTSLLLSIWSFSIDIIVAFHAL
jgi:hypothetical protein